MSRYLQKMINWVAYQGDQKPTESITDDRWRAMVAHIKREYLCLDEGKKQAKKD